MPTNYEPTAFDAIWLSTVLSLLADGGVLVYPSTDLMYTIDKPNATLTLEMPLHDGNRETHERTIEVARSIGWKVEENCSTP